MVLVRWWELRFEYTMRGRSPEEACDHGLGPDYAGLSNPENVPTR